MFDVFYSGIKPNQFAHEREANSIEHARTCSRTRYFWWITYLCDYSEWDWLYEPPPWQATQRHAWSSQWQKDSGTYLIPRSGYTDTNYHAAPIVHVRSNRVNWTVPEGIEAFDTTWHPDPTDPPMTYQFGTQHQRTGGPRYINGDNLVKYIDTPRALKISQDNCWIVPYGTDTNSFDWTWHPDDTEPPYIYQFGTQHQRTGGPQYRVPSATNIKFVDQIRVTTNRVATALIEIDHLDGAAGAIPNTTRRVRYFDNYRDTLIRIARSIHSEHEFVWICSSICDYSNFDFSWHPEQWQASMLHVFASDGEKFGDTFFMHVPTFLHRSDTCQLLEWYNVNFISKSVPRWPLPIVRHAEDSHVEVVKSYEQSGPLTLFTNREITAEKWPAINLWRKQVQTVIPLDVGAGAVIVPKAAVPYIKTQLYDYPYIDKIHRDRLCADLQDVVFISYDEPLADRNWQILKDRCPRATRVHGVAGMIVALEAAANVSTTPWYFAVFAKTRLHETFDFRFVPDYMQQPKHYIFDCLNMSNQLQYGHMGIVMYNCQGIQQLNQKKDFGIDYTLSFSHESVPILSCYGEFATTPYHAWRTAFRECSKLAYFESTAPSVEGAYRLSTWCKTAQEPHSQWVLKGANDGVDFFNSTNGDVAQLKQSFRWEWLRSYFVDRYRNLE